MGFFVLFRHIPMNLLRNFSIRTKLILISLFPVLGLLFYLQENVRSELKNKNAAEQVLLDVAEIEKLTSVIHELQKERGLMVSYVSSKGRESKDGLISQRENTDKAVFALNHVLAEHNRTLGGMWLLDTLTPMRAKVNSFKYDERDNDAFTEGKLQMLEEVNRILRQSSSQGLKSRFEDHLFLLYSKDYLGIIRGALAKAIIDGRFTALGYGSFASSKGKYEINFNKLRRLASTEMQNFLEKKFQGPFVQQMNNCIDAAFVNQDFREFPCTFDDWYSSSTASINLLKEAEDFSSELIRKGAEQESATASANLFKAIAIAALIIVLVIAAAAVTIRDIVNAVTRIKITADLMSSGNIDASIEIDSTDEIGNLATSFRRMIESTKQFAIIAETIGRGDYSPIITPRGDDDVLGRALEAMRSNLLSLSKENQIRNWLLAGNAELNNKMRGEKDVKTLAQDVIIQISTYLKAQIGAIYLRENGQFDLVGSYAFHHRKGNANSFRPGHGLVGQAALEKKLILFSDIPSDYLKINSGLGNALPRNIIVFPFVYEEEVRGVVEMGAAHEFTELDVQFLNMVGENIAIAFNSSQSRDKLKDLLEETQRQAEELESQQEELKQANEELMEKTGLLEKSEAELKAQQEELQQTNEELSEKASILEEQKETLEATKIEIENKARELEEISKYKSEFLANMSHELRTPLNSILILAQLLADNKSGALKDKEAEFAKNIYNSGADLLSLINEILDLSKVEAGKMELEITEFPVNDVVVDMRSMFSEVAKTKSIDFIIKDEDNLQAAVISADKQRLEQILRNLLSNAFKFTPADGRVELIICKPPLTELKDRKLVNEDVIGFRVKDNGIGIPLDKHAVIFEAFQQADGSTKRKYGGTGLGLSICRELANALGGEIQLESQQDEGSCFTLFLPIRLDPSQKGRRRNELPRQNETRIEKVLQAQEPGPGENVEDDRYSLHENDKSVLIMEDDRDFAKILLGFVRERRYKGIIASQGNTGLSYARHYKPDAIILDMKLPVMDGAEVLRQLKNDPSLRHIPVQIISGYDRRKEGMELGAFDYVRKPISKEDFQNAFDKIEDFMSRKLKKLLIVEDNELQNKAIRELIGNGDVKCFSSYSGKDAYELMKKEKFDCTIVDLGLPDMSGFDLLELIKSDARLRQIPTIVYTGKDLSREETARLNRLANTVVLKTADSKERLLDETSLFLHRVESKLPKEKQNIIRRLHKTDEVLKEKIVLVVDDDIRNIYSLTNVLVDEGMTCLVAENGKSALKMLQENPTVDIVLMDVMMPEMDGYDATREIRKSSRYEKLPIIALTAKAMKGDREKCLSAGMSDYISKPVNIEQLLSLMRVWLYKA
jgi:CheY-like chemotaxis protein/HAMP domain-containing protein